MNSDNAEAAARNLNKAALDSAYDSLVGTWKEHKRVLEGMLNSRDKALYTDKRCAVREEKMHEAKNLVDAFMERYFWYVRE